MTKKYSVRTIKNYAVTALVLVVMVSAPVVRADERSALEQLRATTMSLIEALVESGVITREKADKLMRDAEEKAKTRTAQIPPTPGTAPETGKDGKRIVRVPYVPESMRREIRDQVKQEVLAQAKEERWGNPGALPDWLDRIHLEGDLRLRLDFLRLDKDNAAPGTANFVSGTGVTRAADLVGANGNINSVPNANTQEDFDRTRLRARLGVKVTISDNVSAGLRITSGNTTGPTSTNQTLGQGFNKYSLVLDRAFINLNPSPWLSLTGGRIANPFFSTDLVWAEDLSFEGFAARYTPQFTPELGGFVTAGWFPLRTDNPLQTSPRNLSALQAGLAWAPTPRIEAKFAAAMYQYHGITGELESNARFGLPSASDYGTRFEYANGIRQRGNTLFIVNALADPLTGATFWGLASEFREANLTASVDIASFDPYHVVLTGDYVKNLGFNPVKIATRTGSQIIDGKDTGYLARLLVGQPLIDKAGDWNASLTYRWLGSDAVVDAFTNSDFGLGGTNNKGFIAGANYGIGKRSWVQARWMASSLIESYAPLVAGSTTAATKFKVDLLQIDLNASF